MASTVLITGCSSGIGRATAELFAASDWNVVATMRDVSAAGDLADRPGVTIAALDVTDESSIEQAVTETLDRFGGIDVVVNNAGYAGYGAVEATSMDQIRRQFDTNVVGLLAVTKAVLPHFRSRGSGVVVNVSSPAGKIGFPLGALYCGSKHAVEGISEAMVYELDAIGVRMKIVEPGAIRTNFATASMDLTIDDDLTEYAGLSAAMAHSFATIDDTASDPAVVAEVVHAAATDGADQVRYTAGADAAEMIAGRAAAGDEAFIAGLRARFAG